MDYITLLMMTDNSCKIKLQMNNTKYKSEPFHP